MTDLSAGEATGQPASPPAAPPLLPAAPAPVPTPPVAVVATSVAPPPAPTLPVAPPPVAPPPVAPVTVAAVIATRAGSWFAGLDPRDWRTTAIVAVIMVATVFGANLVNAAVPLPTDPGTVSPGPEVPAGPGPGPGQPTAPPVEPGPVAPGGALDVGYGVVVYPPSGWTVVGSESGQVVLQKAGALVIVVGLPWKQSPTDLASAYRDAFFATGQLTAGQPESGEIGTGIPAVALSYTGILEGTQVDGAIFAGASGGTGAVVNVFAAKGGLEGLGSDVEAIVGTIQVTGGEG